jgi:hypothetical protein
MANTEVASILAMTQSGVSRAGSRGEKMALSHELNLRK